MSISKEIGDSLGRFKTYVDRLIALIQKHEIHSIPGLVDAFRNNEVFSADWKAIWSDIADADGGKISLSTAGAILGAVLGGVGIAAMGGAIGLPLALVLGLGGLIAGAEFDSVRSLTQTKIRMLILPRTLHSKIAGAARAGNLSENELIVGVLSEAFAETPGFK